MKLRRYLLHALVPIGLGVAAMAAGPAQAADVRVIGSGASFPFPIYSAWFKDFSKASRGVTVDYQAKGSGAGIQDLINHTVDFAASDAAMTDEQIAQVKGGVVLLPMTAGEIVLAYNLPGVTELKLPRDVYPEIFLGNITSWNDPRIAAANPGVTLPDTHDHGGPPLGQQRHHLRLHQPPQRRSARTFKSGPGAGTTVQWPDIGQDHRGAEERRRDRHDQADPGRDRLHRVRLRQAHQGADGDCCRTRPASSSPPAARAAPVAAGRRQVRATDLRAWIDDPEDAEAYPIATFTWMLFYKEQDPAKAEAMRKMVEYGLTDGQKMADSMGYIPLPAAVVEKVRAATAAIM